MGYSEYVEKLSGHLFLKSPRDKIDYLTNLNLKDDGAFLHTMNTHTDFQRFKN